MIEIIETELTNKWIRYKLRELIEDMYSFDHNAFIGKVGEGPDNALYIVNYNTIMLGTSFRKTWSELDCPVYIERFVDLKITIVERTNT